MPRFTQALIAAGVLFALSIGPLGAQPAPPTVPEVTPAVRHLSSRLFAGQNLERQLEYWRNEFRQSDADMNGEVNEADIAMHSEAGKAMYRMQMLATMLSADFDGDGAVTEDEMRRLLRYHMRGQHQGQQPNEAVESQIQRLKMMDTDGDGRVTIAEALKSATAQAQQAGQMHAQQARLLLTLAPEGKKSVKLSDIEPAVEALFRTVDTDGDNKLSQDEIKAYRLQPNQPEGQVRLAAEQAMRQREEARRAAEAKRLRDEAEANAACAMPKASEAAKVVLIGGYGSDVLSSATIGTQDVAVSVGNVIVESGEGPVYLVLISHRPMIWRFYGAVDRIERVVLSSNTTGPNRGLPHEKPLAGAMGIAAERITFLGQPTCLSAFFETPSSQAAITSSVVRRETGKDIAATAARYAISDVAVPSGRIAPETTANRGLVVIERPSGRVRIEGETSTIVVEGAPDNSERDLGRFGPDGVIEINPRRVVSSLPAERYEVLPRGPGLRQLVRSGAIARNGQGEYLIKRKIRFPADLYGASMVRFVLLRGVPLPDGDPGHCEVISEETGEELKFGGRG